VQLFEAQMKKRPVNLYNNRKRIFGPTQTHQNSLCEEALCEEVGEEPATFNIQVLVS
jgi:hypothetical protein